MMKRSILVAMIVLAAASGAGARATADDDGSDVCVGVGIGNAPPDNLACLNAKLRRSALAAKDQADQSMTLQGAAARDTGPDVNVFNEAATKERLGSSFGQSAIPQRPQATYANPLLNGGR